MTTKKNKNATAFRDDLYYIPAEEFGPHIWDSMDLMIALHPKSVLSWEVFEAHCLKYRRVVPEIGNFRSEADLRMIYCGYLMNEYFAKHGMHFKKLFPYLHKYGRRMRSEINGDTARDPRIPPPPKGHYLVRVK